MSLSDIAIRRPVFTMVIMLAIMVMGGMSWRSLGTDLFPDVTFPVVTITTVYPGAAPSEVESQVSKPIEDAVAGINDLDTVRSFSRESVSAVVVLFKLSADIDKAAQDVRERVAAARGKLPTDVREPTIRRIDVGAAPVLTYVAKGAGQSNEELRRVTEDQLKPLLERVPGVAGVEVYGGKDREVQVEVDRKKLLELNLPLTSVTDKLRIENLSVPAGHYAEGKQEISVRMTGDLRTAEEVAEVVVATTQAGTQIKLKDIAKVYDGYEEMRSSIRANGKPAVAFEVIKQSGTNTIQVVEAVKKALAANKEALPEWYSPSLIVDQSVFIQENAHEVEIAIFYGGGMAILVILLFMLDFRSTFISSLALPTSVIGTFALMQAMGFTLNMMTLLALSLAIGLLIDDAVVVRENIFRHLEMGEPPEVAASKGTSEIALAVLATTLTIVAVFLPVAFMSGVVGQFFKQFGLTISAATLLSLFVAFTLDPMLSAKLAVKIDHHAKKPLWVRFFEAIHNSYEQAYASILRWTVRNRLITVLLGMAAFVGSMQLAKLMGSDFVAPEDRGQFVVDLELPPGTSLEETDERTRQAELDMLKNKYITTVYARLGPNSEINKVQWRVVAVDKRERTQTIWDIQEEVRGVLAKIQGAKVTITPPAFVEGLPSGAALQIQVRGSDLALLERDALGVEAILRSIPGVGDIQVGYSPGKPEQTITIDRQKAADLGIPIALLARTIRGALEGEEAGKLKLEENAKKEVKIRVRLGENDRKNLQSLLQLQVPAPNKGFVPLSELARVEPQAGPQVIERQDRVRQINVTGVPTNRSLGEIVTELEAKLAEFKFSGDGYFRLDGQVKQMKESSESMGTALALGVIFIYLILAAQFESFLHPMTIMLSLPLAFIGAFVALFMADRSMNMGSNIGVILLMGLVTKNGILLVDAALQLQREGHKAVDAIVEAGTKRMRPILMTSSAMILGMLPTATDNGPGSEFRSPMAIAVIGGVISSTILTLLVLPSVFLWFDSARGLFGRVFSRKPKDAEAPQRPEPMELPDLAPSPATRSAESPDGLVGLPGAATSAVLAAVLLGAGLLLTPTSAVAEEEARPAAARAEGLSLTDAVRRALRHNTDLKVAVARIEEADAQRGKIRTAWLPDVKAVGQYQYNNVEAKFDFGQIAKAFGFPAPPGLSPTVIQAHNQVAGVVSVDQTVFAMTPILMAEASKKGIDAQRMGVDAARREITYRIHEVYYNLTGLERLLQAARRARDLADERLLVYDKRRVVGTEGELPILRAQVEKSRAEQDILRAEMGREQLLEVLGILMGETPPASIAPAPAVTMPAGSLEAWVREAKDNRPDIAARRQALDAQKTLIREAELRWLPVVAANGTWRITNVKGFVGQYDSWFLQLNLVLPLFDRGQRYADLHERRTAMARLEAELEKSEQDIRGQLRQAWVDVQTARKSIEIAKKQSEIARRSAEIAAKSQAAGVSTALEVAEADTNLRLSEANEAREQIQLDLAVLKLRHLSGQVRSE